MGTLLGRCNCEEFDFGVPEKRKPWGYTVEERIINYLYRLAKKGKHPQDLFVKESRFKELEDSLGSYFTGAFIGPCGYTYIKVKK